MKSASCLSLAGMTLLASGLVQARSQCYNDTLARASFTKLVVCGEFKDRPVLYARCLCDKHAVAEAFMSIALDICPERKALAAVSFRGEVCFAMYNMDPLFYDDRIHANKSINFNKGPDDDSITESNKIKTYRHLNLPDTYSLMQWAQTKKVYEHDSLIIGGGSEVGLYNTPVRERLIRTMMRRAVNITSLQFSSFAEGDTSVRSYQESLALYNLIDWSILHLPQLLSLELDVYSLYTPSPLDSSKFPQKLEKLYFYWHDDSRNATGTSGLSGLLDASSSTLIDLELKGFDFLDINQVELPTNLIKLKLDSGLKDLIHRPLYHLKHLDISLNTFRATVRILEILETSTLTSLVLHNHQFTFAPNYIITTLDQLTRLLEFPALSTLTSLKVEVSPDLINSKLLKIIEHAQTSRNLTISRISQGESWKEQVRRS